MAAGQDHSRAWSVKSTRDRTTIELRCRLTPKSSRDAIEGMTETPDGPAIKARVRAVPENGAANKALIASVAKWLSVPKTGITLSAGGKSRTKTLAIVVSTDSELTRLTAALDDLTAE